MKEKDAQSEDVGRVWDVNMGVDMRLWSLRLHNGLLIVTVRSL